MAEIYLAGGCFWGLEEYFSRINGVTSTTVGYVNGKTFDSLDFAKFVEEKQAQFSDLIFVIGWAYWVNFWKIKQIVAVFIKNDWIWTREVRRYIKKLMKIFIFPNKISNLFSNLPFSKKYFLRFKRFSKNKS